MDLQMEDEQTEWTVTDGSVVGVMWVVVQIIGVIDIIIGRMVHGLYHHLYC